MREFNFRLLEALLALTIFSTFTTPVTSHTHLKHDISITTMADA
jgi:hypothetical protein